MVPFVAIVAILALGPGRGLAQEGAPAFQSVVVRPGDTLWSIANRYLKDPTRWNEILKYNKLPSSDPTVALPGMTLAVPVLLIKEDLRAARLVYLINRVLFRRRETADWKGGTQDMELFIEDTLRTLENSKARVQFVNKDLLSLDENSMAILKPPRKSADLELLRGRIHATRSKVITASAVITPKTRDTRYSASIKEDLSTQVQVYRGKAAVEAQGKTVEVPAGFSTDIPLNQTPAAPMKMPNLPEFEAAGEELNAPQAVLEGSRVTVRGGRAAAPEAGTGAEAPDIKDLQITPQALEVGIPVQAFHVQLAKDQEFTQLLHDKTYDAVDGVNLGALNLAPGRYWVRLAVVDLLGMKSKFSAPKEYRLGGRVEAEAAAQRATLRRQQALLEVLRPRDGEALTTSPCKVMGRGSAGMELAVNGTRVRMDEEGYFSADIPLQKGPNLLTFVLTDPRGDQKVVTRRVTLSSR